MQYMTEREKQLNEEKLLLESKLVEFKIYLSEYKGVILDKFNEIFPEI